MQFNEEYVDRIVGNISHKVETFGKMSLVDLLDGIIAAATKGEGRLTPKQIAILEKYNIYSSEEFYKLLVSSTQRQSPHSPRGISPGSPVLSPRQSLPLVFPHATMPVSEGQLPPTGFVLPSAGSPPLSPRQQTPTRTTALSPQLLTSSSPISSSPITWNVPSSGTLSSMWNEPELGPFSSPTSSPILSPRRSEPSSMGLTAVARMIGNMYDEVRQLEIDYENLKTQIRVPFARFLSWAEGEENKNPEMAEREIYEPIRLIQSERVPLDFDQKILNDARNIRTGTLGTSKFSNDRLNKIMFALRSYADSIRYNISVTNKYINAAAAIRTNIEGN